jgi:hypothetical protein
MVAKTLVAAIAALLTVISAPALAQQENATRCPGGVCRPIPPGPRPPPIYTYPQFDYSQQQPRLCVEIGAGLPGELQFEWPHDAAGRRICRVFAAPGSYCECTNRLGEFFGGIVR